MLLDDLNKAILEELNDNSRQSFADIGKKVGLSPSSVRERVAKLEEEGAICRYDLCVDYNKLGYDIRAIITVKTFTGKERLFYKILPDLPAIKQCLRITGEDCLTLQGVFVNNQHLVDTLDVISEYGDTKTSIILADMVKGQRLFS